jgi:hypothetical protein
VLVNDILGETTTTNNTANSTSSATTTNQLLSLTIASGPSHGTAVAALANGTITYTPTGLFYGQDSFTYTITDSVSSSTATVNVTVTPVPPTANPAYETVTCGLSSDIDVLANDTAGPGGFVTLTILSGPSANQGIATVTAANYISFAASVSYDGSASFTYQVMWWNTQLCAY